MIDKTNELYLSSLHPKYRDTFTRFISHIMALGFRPQINSAYRDFAKQARLKAEDKRNASPGLSMHNYGLAIDVQVSKDGQVYGKNTPKAIWLTTGIPQIAESMGLFWGANFPGYSDAVHFEVKGMNTSRLQQTAFKQFKTTDPNLIRGNEVIIA